MTEEIPADLTEAPFFVSFPRSGSHMVNLAMELYFDRPRLFTPGYNPPTHDRLTFLDPSRSDYMWVQTHDMTFKTRSTNVVYLYRDPVDVAFSWLMATGKPSMVTDPTVYNVCRGMKVNYSKWMGDPGGHFTYVRYEDYKADPVTGLFTVVEHFGMPWDQTAAAAAVAKVTPEAVRAMAGGGHYKRFFSADMSSGTYAALRVDFRSHYAKMVYDLTITPNTEKYLGTYK
jgi:Sulfotransferase domain